MLSTRINKEKLFNLLAQGKERAAERHRPILVSLVQPLHSETNAVELFINDFPHKGRGMFWSKPASGIWMTGSGAAATVDAASSCQRASRRLRARRAPSSFPAPGGTRRPRGGTG